MTRVAAIDCGTNSIRLLIADLDGYGGVRDVVRTRELVRLGEGVDRAGRFGAAALERTLAATRRYAKLCREHGVQRTRFVATSATRDAANRTEFTEAVYAILGVPAEVISGTEEAELSFRGALTALHTSVLHTSAPPASVQPPSGPAPAQHLVVDLGGGSTELVLGAGTPHSAHSMDVGCVRLTERYAHSDPLREPELARIRGAVAEALEDAARDVDLAQATQVVGVAGTITTITAHALGLRSYDAAAINASTLPLAAVQRSCDTLSRMPRQDRAALPYMQKGRADVIATGAVVWSTILQAVSDATTAAGSPLETVITSEHDILDGIALSLAPEPRGTQ